VREPNLSHKKALDALKLQYHWSLSLDRFKAIARKNDPESLPYKIVDIAGKGLGVLATRTIERGSVVMSESPILIANVSVAHRQSYGLNDWSARLCRQGL
jgi:hypothetical protein